MKTKWNFLHNWPLYVMLLPSLTILIIFSYIPMYGIVIAFQDFIPSNGFFHSKFVGLKWFENIYHMPDFVYIARNTIVIACSKIVLGLLMSVLFALLLNEVNSSRFKKIIQTSVYLPHFLSWVIVSGIMINMSGNSGAVNSMLEKLGFAKANILTTKASFRFLLIYSNVWKEAGWSMIIYLAAISGIDASLYEAATVDGANRFHKMIHITWPGIKEMVVVMLILAVGNAMNAGFDQILNMYNPAVYSVVDILDTYIYRMTFEKGMPFEVSTVIGLFKGVTNAVLLLGANYFAKLLGGRGLV